MSTPPAAPPWQATVRVDLDTARALVARVAPELSHASMRVLGEGFDNLAVLVDPHWVFRFPRREFGRQALEDEVAALPLVAPAVGVQVPQPRWVGTPAEGFPYLYTGARLVPGRTGDALARPGAFEAPAGARLGGFLSRLHAIPVDAARAAGVPGDRIHRADMSRRLPRLLQVLAALGAGGVLGDVSQESALLVDLSDTSTWAGPPVVSHGDLYGRHLVHGPDGDLVGVIDWGDVHLGDPAVDLSLGWSWCEGDARRAFLDAYGPVDPATWARARFRALHYGVLLLDYGEQIGDAAIAELGRAALRRTRAP